MIQTERLCFLLNILIAERGERIPIPDGYAERRALLRALVNVRPPEPVPAEFLRVQDEFLRQEAEERGIVALDQIPGGRVSLWQGDITRLGVDAIVNAANSALLGCFLPGHRCIDNVIHTCAGVQLRAACADLMRGRTEPTGSARITPAFNLPCRYVLHTVGPIVDGPPRDEQRAQLRGCYLSCLALARDSGLESAAFCCISTGEFRFPRREAARIAVDSVRGFLRDDRQIRRVVFDVFLDEDREIYERLLG